MAQSKPNLSSHVTAMVRGIAQRFPESPHAEKRQAPIMEGKGARLNIPVAPPVRAFSPGQPIVTNPVEMLDLQLPLDVDDILTGDVERLKHAHGFIHSYDFLTMNERYGHLAIENDYAILALRVYYRYEDPFLGTLVTQQVVEEDVFEQPHAREVLMHSLVEGIWDARVEKLVELMSTIDYAKEKYAHE